jgi:hypothetical protein
MPSFQLPPLDTRLMSARPKATLPTVAPSATTADLEAAMTAAQPVIGSRIGVDEAPFLVALATHPSADDALRAKIASTFGGLPQSDAVKARGFGAFLAALTASTPAPPSSGVVVSPPGGTSAPVSTGSVAGGSTVLGVQTTGASHFNAAGQVKALPIPPALKGIVRDADDAREGLNLDATRKFAMARLGLSADQAKEMIKKPSDLMKGTLKLDVGALVSQMDPQLGALLQGVVDVDIPYVQFAKADGNLGAHIVKVDTSDPVHGYKDVIATVKEWQRHGIVIDDMTELGEAAYVAGPDPQTFAAALHDERPVKCTGHRGAIEVLEDEHGNDERVTTNWPSGYGRDWRADYTPLLSLWTLDGVATTGAPLSADEKQGYYDTVKSYELLNMMGVEFTSGDTRQGFTDYHFSPMEDLNPKDMGSRLDLVVENSAASLTALKARSFYCAEGITTSIHQGTSVPLNQWSVDQGFIQQGTLDKLKKMKAAFDAAGGMAGKGAAKKGWQALVQQGFISPAQFDKLDKQKLTLRPLRLSPDDLVSLQARGVKGLSDDGLVHKPQHIGGLTQAMLAVSFPREGMTRAITQLVGGKLAGLPPLATDALAQKLGLPQGALALDVAKALGWALSAGVQKSVLSSTGMRDTIKKSAGYDHMDAPSQKRFHEMLDGWTDASGTKQRGFIDVVGDPTLSREQLNAELERLNDVAARENVNFSALSWQGLIRHVPPQGSRDYFLGVSGTNFLGLRPIAQVVSREAGA